MTIFLHYTTYSPHYIITTWLFYSILSVMTLWKDGNCVRDGVTLKVRFCVQCTKCQLTHSQWDLRWSGTTGWTLPRFNAACKICVNKNPSSQGGLNVELFSCQRADGWSLKVHVSSHWSMMFTLIWKFHFQSHSTLLKPWWLMKQISIESSNASYLLPDSYLCWVLRRDVECSNRRRKEKSDALFVHFTEISASCSSSTLNSV